MTKFVAISDTHGCHRQLNLPAGDVLIHAGDVCDRGNREQVEDFFEWFSSLDYQHKIIIWGNHDFDLQTKQCLFPSVMPDGVVCLGNQGIAIGASKIWGVPSDWSKQGERWDLIPEDVDLLITHRPPFRVLDRSRLHGHQGSRSLAERLVNVQPKVHLFGHIHREYGVAENAHGQSINASLYRSSKRQLVNPPVEFSLASD